MGGGVGQPKARFNNVFLVFLKNKVKISERWRLYPKTPMLSLTFIVCAQL